MPDDVYRAIDAVLVLGVDDASSPEGEAADGLISEYDLNNVVGRLTDVVVTVNSQVKPFYEIGRRYPTHLRPGTISTKGTADRAHVNGAMLRLLLGEGAVSPPGQPNFPQPAFNMVTTLRDPSRPDQHSELTLFGVKFDNWNFAIPSEDFVIESVSFQALRVAFAESR